MRLRINVGCGQTPTKGWKNFDNSPSLFLARLPVQSGVLRRLRIINTDQESLIRFAREHEIFHANAIRGLPLDTGSCDAVYSSHMLEHLDLQGVESFLKEAMRVLCSGGIIRLAVPDLAKYVSRYIQDGDADRLVTATHLSVIRPRSFAARLKQAFTGPRHHLWMYDGNSLCRLLERQGFSNATITAAGQTSILDAGALDLRERCAESVYVEAKKP